MRAMVLRGKTLAVEEVERPRPQSGEVLAKVLACGICGSDLHYARFADDLRDSSRAERGVLANADVASGIVMGHEFIAEVVEAGKGVTSWQKGDRVASMPVLVPQDGRLGDNIGYSARFPGAYGEFVILSAPLLLRVPSSLSDRLAALTEPCGVALHAVREAALPPSSAVLVMGAGPIGMLTMLWLKAEGHRVVVSDPAPSRRDLASSLDADVVLDPSDDGFAASMTEALGAPPAVIFECVGVQGTLQQAMELVARRGRVIVVGVCMLEDRVRPLLAINKHLTLQFVLGYSPQEFAEALEALGSGKIDGSRVVTRTVSLDELPAAFASLGDPKDCKVVLEL
ncbi:MAG TPA: zinc-binding dehydrogenase [Dehalococcoidia bacterium]